MTQKERVIDIGGGGYRVIRDRSPEKKEEKERVIYIGGGAYRVLRDRPKANPVPKHQS